MEQTQVGLTETHRCPACQEPLNAVQDEFVACSKCLVRHHVECWSAESRCGACQGGTPLVSPTTSRFRPLPVADGPPQEPPSSLSADAVRFSTQNALDAEHRRNLTFATAVLTPLTLGAYPILSSEAAFSQHAAANKADERPLPGATSREILARLRIAREHAYDWSRPLAAFRAVVPSIVLVVALIAGFAAVSTGIDARDRELLKVAYVCQLVALGALFLHLHVFRETVRRHEFHQFFGKLVTDAVPPARAKEVLRVTRKAWHGRRAVDAILTLLGVIPVLGLVLLPIAGARMHGALLLHEEHEEGFPRARR